MSHLKTDKKSYQLIRNAKSRYTTTAIKLTGGRLKLRLLAHFVY